MVNRYNFLMHKIDVAGLKIDTLPKSELIDKLKNRIALNQQTWVTTVYSEFLYAALKDPRVMTMLNQADIAVPDGIGIFWAHKFLNLPLTAKSYLGKILQSLWQIKLTLLKLLFKKRDFETIPGSELIWDIAKMAEENNFSIYLLGGFGNTPKLVSNILITKYPGLRIAGFSGKNPEDPTIYEDIKKASPDILFVAYGPIKQEAWIQANLKNLPVKLAIGLGGTFDYIAKKRLNPPKFVRKMGLEWLFRLITQPYRLRRIFNATFGLIAMLMRYKIFNSYPLRQNVAVVILNKENKVLIGERSPKDFYIDLINSEERLKQKNYWQLPQGGIDKGEETTAAAKREAFEETGIKNLDLIKISDKTNIYYWNNALRKLFKNRNHKNCGQKQTIVYLKFLGSDTEIHMDQKEFIGFKWASIQELNSQVHPERETLAKIVQNDLKEMLEKAII